MLRVNLRDGRTLSYDLNDPALAGEWLSLSLNPEFQDNITAVSLSRGGVIYSFPKPSSLLGLFSAHIVQADYSRKIKGGELIRYKGSSLEATLMIHSGQRAARIDICAIGEYVVRGNLDK